jgi:hypothetical protein
MGNPWKSVIKADKAARQAKKEATAAETRTRKRLLVAGGVGAAILVVVGLVLMWPEGESVRATPDEIRAEAARLRDAGRQQMPAKTDEKK